MQTPHPTRCCEDEKAALGVLRELRKMGNSASTAQLKVERAEKTGVLSLRDAGAEKVPEKIFRLANLRVLDLAQLEAFLIASDAPISSGESYDTLARAVA